MAAGPAPHFNAIRTYVDNGTFMPRGRHETIFDFVYHAAFYQRAPIPRIPQNDPRVWRIVYEGEAALVQLNDEPAITKPSTLYTCAAIIYACRHTNKAWVHHSPSGQLSPEQVHEAIDRLGAANMRDQIFVICANRQIDESYEHLTERIAVAGIPRSNILALTGYQNESFGIDNHGHVGFC